MKTSERGRTEEPDDGLGEAMPTLGLTRLDQLREASMADEGGASGAVMESQDEDALHGPTTRRPNPRAGTFVAASAPQRRRSWIVPALLGVLGALLTAGALRRALRS